MTSQPDTVHPPDDDAESPPQPVYSSVGEWVTSHFLPMFRRPLGGEFRWCSQWWQHAEAITRLTALWHTWEALRLQPGTGMATWLRDHLDHQLPVLLGRTGPFSMCSEDEHINPRQARTRQPPHGWWDPGPPPSARGAEPAEGLCSFRQKRSRATLTSLKYKILKIIFQLELKTCEGKPTMPLESSSGRCQPPARSAARRHDRAGRIIQRLG